MTAIRFYRTSHGGFIGFSVIGHTGSRPSGEDIVCAAVSAISITAVNALEVIAQIGATPYVSDGVLHVRFRTNISQKKWAKAQIILRTAWLGLSEIATMYPQYVRIS